MFVFFVFTKSNLGDFISIPNATLTYTVHFKQIALLECNACWWLKKSYKLWIYWDTRLKEWKCLFLFLSSFQQNVAKQNQNEKFIFVFPVYRVFIDFFSFSFNYSATCRFIFSFRRKKSLQYSLTGCISFKCNHNTPNKSAIICQKKRERKNKLSKALILLFFGVLDLYRKLHWIRIYFGTFIVEMYYQF